MWDIAAIVLDTSDSPSPETDAADEVRSKKIVSLFLGDKFHFLGQDPTVDVVVEKRMAPEFEEQPSFPADDDADVDWESGVLPKHKQRKRQVAPEQVLEAIMDATMESAFGESAAELLV